MKNNDIKTWYGDPPQACDICGLEITTEFIDGRTDFRGMWGCMCLDCHKQHGVGLGTGRGQKYHLQNDKFVKVDG